jgi:hypothetical protein
VAAWREKNREALAFYKKEYVGKIASDFGSRATTARGQRMAAAKD